MTYFVNVCLVTAGGAVGTVGAAGVAGGWRGDRVDGTPAEQFGYVVGTLACPMLIGVIAVAGIVWGVWYYRR